MRVDLHEDGKRHNQNIMFRVVSTLEFPVKIFYKTARKA